MSTKKKETAQRLGTKTEKAVMTEGLMTINEMMAIMKRIVKANIGKNYTYKGVEKCLQSGGGTPTAAGVMLSFLYDVAHHSKSWGSLRETFIKKHGKDIMLLSRLDNEVVKLPVKKGYSLPVILLFGLMCRLMIIPNLSVEFQYLFLTRCFDLEFKESTVKRVLTGINLSSRIFTKPMELIKQVKNIRMEEVLNN